MEQSKKIYKLTVPDYYRVVLEMISFSKPYSDMRSRQKDVFAEILRRNDHYSAFTIKERNKLIFNKDTWEEIANKLNVLVPVVNNVLSELRKLDLIVTIDGIEYINPKYILTKVDIIGFNFIENGQ